MGLSVLRATQKAKGKALVVRTEPRSWYRHLGVDRWSDLILARRGFRSGGPFATQISGRREAKRTNSGQNLLTIACFPGTYMSTILSRRSLSRASVCLHISGSIIHIMEFVITPWHLMSPFWLAIYCPQIRGSSDGV